MKSASFVTLLLAIGANAQHLDLDPELLHETLKTHPVLVFFTNVDNLMNPEHRTFHVNWEDAGSEYTKQSRLRIGTFNCFTNEVFCDEIDVHEFPKFVGFMNNTILKYDGIVDLQQLLNFGYSLHDTCTQYNRNACSDYAHNYLDHLMLLTEEQRKDQLDHHMGELIELQELQNARNKRVMIQRSHATNAEIEHEHHSRRLEMIDAKQSHSEKSLEHAIEMHVLELRLIKSTLNPTLVEDWVHNV